MTPTEQNYWNIERETLAIVYGCEKVHYYVFMNKFAVYSNQKPLENILNKPLHKIPGQLQKFVLRLQKYNFKVKYIPGKDMHIADNTLSRAPIELKPVDADETSQLQVDLIMDSSSMSVNKKEEFIRKTNNDVILNKVKDRIINGWPYEKQYCPLESMEYWYDIGHPRPIDF